MKMFASLLCSPISSGRIIIIVIRLPYEWWICRMTHPDQKSGCIIPHFIIPCFIHSFHYFNIQQLSFLTELFQTGRFPELCIYWFFIIDRVGIGRFFTKEMLIPNVIIIIFQLFISRQRPPWVLGYKQFHTLKCRKGSRSYFSTQTIAMIYTIRISRFIECQITARSLKMMFRRLISPPSTSG